MLMSKLRIGTAGIPHSVKRRSSQDGIRRLKELGLDCMEIEFVRSVQMKEPTALEVRQVAEEQDIALTVHAPYYVNLNSKEPDKIEASKQRVVKAAVIGAKAGAKSVTFHPAFYHQDDPKEVYLRVADGIRDIRRRLDDNQVEIDLRPETTGSGSQFGTVAEIVELSSEIPGVYPCIDFSHLFARSTGEENSYEVFAEYLTLVRDHLGQEALDSLHIHLSGIDYGPKGEKKHLILPESEINYQAVLKALVDFKVGGWLICESPNLEEDALLIKRTYDNLLGDNSSI